MNTPQTNNELIQLLKVQEATQQMVLEEIRQMRKGGGNGETLLPDSIIIKGILEKQNAINRLMEVELQLKEGVYHKSKLKRFIWRLKRKLIKLLK